MDDFVSCLLCGHAAQTLARHLKAAHGITADAYRGQFPGARIRSESCEANRRAAIAQAHAEKPRKGLKKLILCPCGAKHEVGLTFASTDLRCPTCKAKDEDAFWVTKVEGQDYVRCVLCGYRAENLTSHVTAEHPDYPSEAPRVAEHSAVRDKTLLKGRQLSDETRSKMSANAGRWNKGLTKDTDPRMAGISEKRIGQPSWSKGLTKADHPSLQSTSDKLSALKTGQPCTNGLKADLSQVDFTPYLDETGAVDRKAMAEELGLCEPTVTKYMEALGLRLSTKYVDARVERDAQSGRFYGMSHKAAEQTTIRLTPEQLEPFKQKNGRVMLGKAMAGLGHVYSVVKRECDRLGIPTARRLLRQGICLEAISKALGGVSYEQEWRAWKFTNPSTGHRFRFDGYFPSHNLIVEFHGYQHWTFPSVYIQKEELYFALQERDRIKENLIHSDPVLRYFLVREDEPYTDPDYLRGRLIDEGYLG